MTISRTFKDGSYPTSKRDQFLAVLASLFVTVKLGFEVELVWIPATLGVLCMLASFIMTAMSKKLSHTIFSRVWWSGIALLFVAVVISLYQAIGAIDS